MHGDVIGLVALAMTVIGFITVWVKLGHNKGRQDEVIETLSKNNEESKACIAGVKEKIHVQEVRIAESLEAIDTLKKKTEENKNGISEIRTKTHGLELRIAEFMGEMRVNINDIKETVNELKSKGGSRASKK